MKVTGVLLGLVCAAGLFGQKRFSWQDYCFFNNPAAPFCPERNMAIKPQPKPGPSAAPKAVINNIFTPPNAKSVKPVSIMVGGIDWRFADPYPDALVGFDLGSLSSSPLAKALVTSLGAKAGLKESDIQKIFENLSDVDQAAFSVKNERVVVMITGKITESPLPPPEAGMKAAAVTGGLLIGHIEQVDQALRRMQYNFPPSELAQVAQQYQSANEFWVTGSPALIGPQAQSQGVRHFSLAVSIRNRMTSDLAIEFMGAPNAQILAALQQSLGAITLEGNTVHLRSSMEANEVAQRFGAVVDGPFGQPLGALIESAKYLPERDHTAPRQTKPVIYGLDDGPRVVGN
jgi:hypothetical protein